MSIPAEGSQPERQQAAADGQREHDPDGQDRPARGGTGEPLEPPRRSSAEATRPPLARIAARRAGQSIVSGTLRLAGQELTDEGVVGVEHVLGRAGLDDPALPQDVDVVGHPARAHDVVGDHAEGRQVLLLLLLGLVHHVAVDLEDQLAQQGGADRIQAGVGLVEQDDVGLEHQRPGEPGALAHPARQLVGHLGAGGGRDRPR